MEEDDINDAKIFTVKTVFLCVPVLRTCGDVFELRFFDMMAASFEYIIAATLTDSVLEYYCCKVTRLCSALCFSRDDEE